MKLLHGNEMHFVRCPDGKVYSTGVAVYSWWQEYRRIFDEVLVAARVRKVSEMYPPERIAEGPGVSFHDLPDFRGPEQYAQLQKAVKSALNSAIEQADAFLFRVPGTIGYLGARELIRRKKPYGYEVVGDPLDVFSAGSVRHLLRLFFRYWHVNNLRNFCQSACAVSYVTEHALQRRYPPHPSAFTTHFSDVGLSPDCFVQVSRKIPARFGPFRLLFVGTLEQLYKAPDVLIKAVGKCRQQGCNVNLTLAGDGAMRKQLETLTAKLNLNDAVHFAGHVSERDAIIKMLDASDLFALPSRAEGLPRAMLEAMARGVPCIGSTVNGIPELLVVEDLVPPGNVNALAAKILEVANSPLRLTQMSRRCLSKAHEFEVNKMRARKIEYMKFVHDTSVVKPQPRLVTPTGNAHGDMYRQYGKKLFDTVAAGFLLLVLSPFMAIIALLIRFSLGTPVLFRQKRPGLHSQTYTLFKFRTMRDERRADGTLLGDRDRQTKLGKFLRNTSLDELPELWNVLTGHMSLVGPRPLLMQYLALYNEEQLRRHRVLPGITGWAQVNGRNAIPWEEKFMFDAWYVDHCSLSLDVRILWMTISRVLQRHGINAAGEVTMPEFQGNNPDSLQHQVADRDRVTP